MLLFMWYNIVSFPGPLLNAFRRFLRGRVPKDRDESVADCEDDASGGSSERLYRRMGTPLAIIAFDCIASHHSSTGSLCPILVRLRGRWSPCPFLYTMVRKQTFLQTRLLTISVSLLVPLRATRRHPHPKVAGYTPAAALPVTD